MFPHVRGNLETKLSELKLPKAVMQEFIWDVFGNPALLQLGFVDAEDSSDLDRQLLQPGVEHRLLQCECLFSFIPNLL